MKLTPLATLIAALLLAGPQARAQGRDATVKLRPHASVPGVAIRLGEIAEFDGLDAASEERLAGLVVAKAAPPGETRSLDRDLIEAKLRRAGASVRLDAPERVQVSSAALDLSPETLGERFERALRHRMPWPAEQATIRALHLPEPFSVPAAATRMRVHFRPDERFVGRVAAQLEWIDATTDTSTGIRRSVSAVVDVRVPLVVLRRGLRRGEAIDASAVSLELRDLRDAPSGALMRAETAVGRRAQRNLVAGKPLSHSDLDAPELVRRGDLLRVEATSPGLDVRLDARALESGRLGQKIRAENPVSRRTLMVEVTGEGSARLSLPGVGSPR